MADIVEATGLSKSSLYGAFGSKAKLLDAALDRYLSAVLGQLLVEFTDGTEGLDDVHRLVDAYHRWLLNDAAGRGCLAVTAASELGPSSNAVSSQAAEYRRTLRAALKAPLNRAASNGEIKPSTVDAAVEQILALLLAASVFDRSRAESREMERLSVVTHQVIDNLDSR